MNKASEITGAVASLTCSKPAQAERGVHPVFSFFACAAILLPAHPSLQSVFLSYGIPSPFVSALLAAPVLYATLSRPLFSRSSVDVWLLFIAYIFWMVLRAIFSPALGQANFILSVQGLLLQTPVALLCALVAARNPKCAALTVFAFGLIALAHFCALAVFNGILGETAGARGLAVIGERQIYNYQSTTFYFGLVGVAMACAALRGRGKNAAYGSLGLLAVIAFMAMVGARASILALAASALAIVALTSFSRLARLAVIAAAGMALIFFAARIAGLFEIEAVRVKLVAFDRFLLLAEEGDRSYRIRLFTAAIAMWLDSPTNFLIGGGLGAFPAFIGETDAGWYPHNFILETLAEGGIIGGLLLVPIAVKLAVEFIRLKSNPDTPWKLYLAALAFYGIVAYQVMGGLQRFWLPAFFAALFLFADAPFRNTVPKAHSE